MSEFQATYYLKFTVDTMGTHEDTSNEQILEGLEQQVDAILTRKVALEDVTRPNILDFVVIPTYDTWLLQHSQRVRDLRRKNRE